MKSKTFLFCIAAAVFLFVVGVVVRAFWGGFLCGGTFFFSIFITAGKWVADKQVGAMNKALRDAIIKE